MADEQLVEKEVLNLPTLNAAWRPMVGWVSVAALAINFVVIPLVKIVAAFKAPTVNVPQLDLTPLLGLVMSLLGMTAVRTVEKFRGVQGNH